MTLAVLTAFDHLAEQLPGDVRLLVATTTEQVVEELTARELELLAREQELIRQQSLAETWEANLSRREAQLAQSTELVLAQPAMEALQQDAREQATMAERQRVLHLIEEQLVWLIPTGHCLAILNTLRRKVEFP